MVGIPLIQAGAGDQRQGRQPATGRELQRQRGARRPPQRRSVQAVTNAANGSATFDKPVDNIGIKTIPDYAGYAAKHVYSVNMPGCAMPAKLFVGQRQDPFAVNLGTIFDLVNAPVAVITNPALINAAPNTIGDKNVTTMAIEAAQELPDQRRRRHRRLDHGQPAPGAAAQPDAAVRPPGHRKARRRLGAGLAAGHAAGQRGGHRPEGQGQVQRLAAQRRRPVHRLRDEPDAAGAAGDRAGHARARRRPTSRATTW